MEVHTSSSGLQHIVGYGPHSVVIAHQNHNHHNNHDHHHHFHSLPPQRSLPQTTTSYQLVPLVPIATYAPVKQQKSQGNHSFYLKFLSLFFLS
jgi:hypothetical protein